MRKFRITYKGESEVVNNLPPKYKDVPILDWEVALDFFTYTNLGDTYVSRDLKIEEIE